MKLPKKIKFGAYEYSVVKSKTPIVNNETVWGFIDSAHQVICIKEDLSEQMLYTVLLHEISHMIMCHAGLINVMDDDQIEVLADVFGHGIFQLASQNKELFDGGTVKTTKTT